jgi:hypothetical protein
VNQRGDASEDPAEQEGRDRNLPDAFGQSVSPEKGFGTEPAQRSPVDFYCTLRSPQLSEVGRVASGTISSLGSQSGEEATPRSLSAPSSHSDPSAESRAQSRGRSSNAGVDSSSSLCSPPDRSPSAF